MERKAYYNKKNTLVATKQIALEHKKRLEKSKLQLHQLKAIIEWNGW